MSPAKPWPSFLVTPLRIRSETDPPTDSGLKFRQSTTLAEKVPAGVGVVVPRKTRRKRPPPLPVILGESEQVWVGYLAVGLDLRRARFRRGTYLALRPALTQAAANSRPDRRRRRRPGQHGL